jgi:DNA polymerase-3 subunit gamma/tau
MTFDQVVGQEAITRTLRNSIKSGRIHHAYLFTGARGVGKTTTARILAKALNCAEGITTDPCGNCASCSEIARSSSIDVQEIDAASHTQVDNVREVILNTIDIAPARDRHKIFIIDEVHQLSNSSFNALLKTLEEPPPHVVFIMATTTVHKVPETILSRCQVFEFRLITVKAIYDQLKRIAAELGVKISDSALLAVARAGDGSMRDAESALDQVISFAGAEVTDEDVSAALGLVDFETLGSLLSALAEQDAQKVIRLVDQVVLRGYDLRNLCRELMMYIRALLVTKVAGPDPELIQLPAEQARELTQLAEAFSEQDLLRFFSILTKTEQDIRSSLHPRFQLEMGLMRLVHARRLILIEDALKQLSEIRSGLGGSATGPAPPTRSTARPPSPDRSSSVRSAPPPSIPEEPVEVEPVTQASSGDEIGERIKSALESRGKRLLASVLGHAEAITVDGDFLRVSYSPSASSFKVQVQSLDNRKLIEEVAQHLVGRRLTLSVTDGLEAPATPGTQTKASAASLRERAEQSEALRVLVDTFQGEVVDVKKTED